MMNNEDPSYADLARLSREIRSNSTSKKPEGGLVLWFLGCLFFYAVIAMVI